MNIESIPLSHLGEAGWGSLAGETQRLEAVYQSKLEAVEELRKSVLQKAFEGEL
ncbi:MAG: hypothetical protein J0M11_05440 [Anaerolineae bacterium]|nr:hypothetical protein [Anaerolineae bacterium]